jgi:FkbM family methyltransferase
LTRSCCRPESGDRRRTSLDLSSPIHVTPQLPAEIEVRAWLARHLALSKNTGLHRWPHKIVRALFHRVHQRLGWPAMAIMTPRGGAPFVVDCTNTGFLDFARRSKSVAGIEPEVSGLFGHLAPQLSVIYDIGANWGFYPLLLGTDPAFTGEMHAFEVQPRTAADLCHVVESSGLADRVYVHAVGLSDRDGEAQLERTRHSYLARIVDGAEPDTTETVQVRRLDGLDLPPPQLIKIDVEGHEAAVLRGAIGLIERHRPVIVFENWSRRDNLEVMLEPLRLLAGCGYEFRRLAWLATSPTRLTIRLVPLPLGARHAFPADLNLLAFHPATANILET